jgi:uncharacterized protein with von Willebrand factor type A (vWA) domain
VTDRFQDGCRRHVGNSSACYKMGNYHPILMKIGTQTKKNMLSSQCTLPEAYAKFEDAAAALLEIQVRAIKWAITTRF